MGSNRGQDADGEVRLNLAGVIPLAAFRTVNSGLTQSEMEFVVGQALILFDDLYAHLLLKQKMHAVDPVQALKLLLLRVREGAVSEDVFHCDMMEIFNSVRDLHTNYLLPQPYSSAVAFLPFMVDSYYDEAGVRHFPVTRVMPAAVSPPFGPGVEITHWNGMPIGHALKLNASDHAGSNAAARDLQGLLTLTSRPLLTSLPPREDWVTLTYRHGEGIAEIRFAWMVFRPQPPANAVDKSDASQHGATATGIDIGLAVAHRARQLLFKPQSATRTAAVASELGAQAEPAASADALANPTAYPDELEYGVRPAASGPVPFLRIRSFDVGDPAGFMHEVARILQILPQTGLVLDVRGNPGGNILAGEHLLQLFTARRITPAPVCFRSTTGTGAFARADFFRPWRDSIALSVRTGEDYSQYVPLSDPETVNALGRMYEGPVVLLTDAACYSTTDFFSAGFQDHRIGPIIGVDQFTGAGGANVWTHELLRQFWPGPSTTAPLRPLPRGMGMRIAFRRSSRVGANAGIPVEDLGVKCDILHRRTRRDIFEDASDLYDKAAAVLQSAPAVD